MLDTLYIYFVMPNIITRYLCREIFKNSAATVLVLYVILMSNSLGRVLSDITDGDIPQQALWPVLFSQSVNVFSLLLPVGVFLGIVFAFGRLYKDNEITVMNACGMGYQLFYRPVLIIVIPLLGFSVYSNLWLNAEVQRNAQETIEREKEVQEFDQVRPGQFNQSDKGDDVFYMESISEDRLALNGVIIGSARDGLASVETAVRGRYKIDEETGDLFLVVGPGKRYEGAPGANDYSIIEFEQHGILVEKRQSSQKRSVDVEEKTPRQLWQSSRRIDRVELHWRIAIPVVLIVLALLAVPLSYIAPRQGRFGKIGYAFLVYIVYLNLMAFCRAQLEAGAIPLSLNFWWVHLLFVFLTIILLIKHNRLLDRPARRVIA